MKVFFSMVLAGVLLTGCSTIKTDNEVRLKTENEIKPIHITIDLNVKIQREIDSFFDDIDASSQTIEATANEQ